MATAFTEQEVQIIKTKLKEAARQFAVTTGVRKTSVDQLALAADISKGAFYKFYPSKEALFFELLEDMHTEIYQASAEVLWQNANLPPAERTAQAVLTACSKMEESGMMDFMERDVPHLLRKIPAEIQEKHYHSDETHIKEILADTDLNPVGGIDLAAATVRGLFLTISHREEIGNLYPEVLHTLVYGACGRLFP